MLFMLLEFVFFPIVVFACLCFPASLLLQIAATKPTAKTI